MKDGKIRYFSMFSGVGGFELGIGNRAECIGFSEIDKYASELLCAKWPGIKNYGDAREINPRELPEFNMLCGGFPCQAFSIAGRRKGFEDTRGTMFFEVARIVEVKRPQIILLENVKGLLNHDKGRTFSIIIQTLNELGYNIQWMVLNSKFFGVPQNRERVFLIGNIRGTSRSEILPFRNYAEQIQGIHEEQIANCLTARYPGHCTLGDIKKSRGQVVYDRKGFDSRTKGFRESLISPTLSTKMGTGGNNVPMVVAMRQRDRHGKNEEHIQQFEPRMDVTNTLTSVEKDNYLFDGSLRRFTPKECERLQSFPDNWTENTSFKNSVKLISKIWKDVKSKNAENQLLSEKRNYVSNIINDGKSGEIQTLPMEEIESIQENVNAQGVIEIVSVEDGVCDITNHGKGMAILYNPNNISKIEAITKKNLILELMEKRNISEFLKITLEENLSRENLFIILTWIKEIIKSQTFISVKTGNPITKAIIVYKKLEQNYTNEGLLDLRMENISYFSDTHRYKMMGNAVTVNVIKAIIEKIL